MARKTFHDLLNCTGLNICAEYQTLCRLLFYRRDEINSIDTLYNIIDANFTKLPIHDTCLNLDEFDERYGYVFDEDAEEVSLDDLLLITEYIANMTYQAAQYIDMYPYAADNPSAFIAGHLKKVCEKIHHHFIKKDSIYILVEDNPVAVEAAQELPEEKAYLPLQYTHHSLAGDIEGKREILRSLGHELESKREALEATDKTLSNDIFFCLNNLNIRHNNVDKDSMHYKRAVAEMNPAQIEEWYDYTYRMMLIALTKIGDYPTCKQMEELKVAINPRG